MKVIGNSNSLIRGITVFAVDGKNTDMLVGDWMPPVRKHHKLYHGVQCDGLRNMMIIERSWSEMKLPVYFAWATPNDCVEGSSYYVRFREMI